MRFAGQTLANLRASAHADALTPADVRRAGDGERLEIELADGTRHTLFFGGPHPGRMVAVAIEGDEQVSAVAEHLVTALREGVGVGPVP